MTPVVMSACCPGSPNAWIRARAGTPCTAGPGSGSGCAEWLPDDPYPRATVTLWPDEPGDPVTPAQLLEVEDRVMALFERIAEARGVALPDREALLYGRTHAGEPGRRLYTLASRIPIGAADRYSGAVGPVGGRAPRRAQRGGGRGCRGGGVPALRIALSDRGLDEGTSAGRRFTGARGGERRRHRRDGRRRPVHLRGPARRVLPADRRRRRDGSGPDDQRGDRPSAQPAAPGACRLRPAAL